MELSPEEVALIMASKGWIYADGPATPETVKAKIRYLIQVIENVAEPGCWSNLGRLMVTQDPEFPSYYSISLEIGLVPKGGEDGEDLCNQ
jgi:hypothetical protein